MIRQVDKFKPLIICAFLLITPLLARPTDIDASEYIGYTILAEMTITGWYDTSGAKKKGDSFEGCEFGRKIIFDNGRTLTCATYSYSYSYRPKAIILIKENAFFMVVNGNSYSMSR